MLLIKNTQDLTNFKKKYFWPGVNKCNKPKKYPCMIRHWSHMPMEQYYEVQYVYLDDLKESARILEEASNA